MCTVSTPNIQIYICRNTLISESHFYAAVIVVVFFLHASYKKKNK